MAVTKDNPRANEGLGRNYRAQGRLEEADEQTEEAYRLRKKDFPKRENGA